MYLVREVKEWVQTGREKITGPEDIARIIGPYFDNMQEKFWAITCSTKNIVLETNLISAGSLNASIVHPRDIISFAFGCKKCRKPTAAAIVLAHCHPTGDPKPSPEDIEFTRKFEEACKVMGIGLHDHVIIGGKNGPYYSLREHGHFLYPVNGKERSK